MLVVASSSSTSTSNNIYSTGIAIYIKYATGRRAGRKVSSPAIEEDIYKDKLGY